MSLKKLSPALIILALFLAACGGTSQAVCVPYGSTGPTPGPALDADPPIGMTPTPTAAESPTPPLPTCAPLWPTWTPWPTVERDSERPMQPIEVATSPQNLTLSPGSETLGSLSSAPGAPVSLSWQGSGKNRMAVHSSFGWRIMDAPEGVEGPLAVSVSPGNRMHVLGSDGRYTFSDGGGHSWSEPTDPVLPGANNPRLLLQEDGFAQAFGLADGTLYTAHQELERWTAPEAIAGGVASYDVTMDEGQGRQLIAVTSDSGGTRLYQDGQQVGSWVGAGFVSVTARDGHTAIGLSRGNWAGAIWQSEVGGAWRSCDIQEISVPGWGNNDKIGQVYAIPAYRQGQIVVLWNFAQPGHDKRGDFPYIVVSQTSQDRCDPFPAIHDAQNLYLQFCGPPGLFKIDTPQSRFSLSLRGNQGVIAFEGLQWNGHDKDIYVAEFNPDTILSFNLVEGE